ncbi:MAG: hypothetical protein ABSH06_08295 [Thermodesulfobacteriota bacterium]
MELLEDELRQLRRLLQKGEGQRLLLHIVDDLTEEEKSLLNERIDRLISYVIHLKDSFDLTNRERVLRWIVKATSVYLSAQMEEVISDKLKGYGEITLEVKETLDPILNEMISILRQMESIV